MIESSWAVSCVKWSWCQMCQRSVWWVILCPCCICIHRVCCELSNTKGNSKWSQRSWCPIWYMTLKHWLVIAPSHGWSLVKVSNRAYVILMWNFIYVGNTYNIPICIWLMDTHPYNAPMCYVKPTSGMQIKVSIFVDHNGKIYLPYLHDWVPVSNTQLARHFLSRWQSFMLWQCICKMDTDDSHHLCFCYVCFHISAFLFVPWVTYMSYVWPTSCPLRCTHSFFF